MPFMVGNAPIRRTLKYLKSGGIIFRENVKVFSFNYSPQNKDARNFLFWHLPQIQYQNPNVQCITFTRLTPTPFIRIFLEDKQSILIDVDGKTKQEIMNHLKNFTAICKTPEELKSNKKSKIKNTHAYFGDNCERHCICEIFGQVPCSARIPVPLSWRKLGRSMLKKLPTYKIPPIYMEPNLEPAEKSNED